MLVVSRSLHQLYADTTRPLLSQYFQKLNELHSMQRDGVIGTLCVCVCGGGCGGGEVWEGSCTSQLGVHTGDLIGELGRM